MSDPAIDRAVELLCSGQLVGMPTETVYGLAGNALDPLAVARIFELKARPHFDPLIVHAGEAEQALSYASQVPPEARLLAERFWPGPLTLILQKRPCIPDLVSSGMPTVALRVPAHPTALALLRAFGGPLAAPSANRFGRISPTRAEHVRAEFGEALSCVLDGGPCQLGVESTIVSLCGERPCLLRPGALALEELEALVGPLLVPSADPKHPLAPGQLPSHYAPRTPMRLAELASASFAPGQRVGALSVGPMKPAQGYARVEVLSEPLDLRRAAAELFAAMHRLDDAGLDLILAELTLDEGLGRAINDRLIRASQRT